MNYNKYHINFVIFMILIIIFNLYFSTFYNVIEYATNLDETPPFQTIYNDLSINLKDIQNLISANEPDFIVLNNNIFLDSKQYYISIAIFSELIMFNKEVLDDNNLETKTAEQYPQSIQLYFSYIKSLFKNIAEIIENYNKYKNDINLIVVDYLNKDVDYTFTNDFQSIYSDLNKSLSDIRSFLDTYHDYDFNLLKSDYAINPDFIIIITSIFAEVIQIYQLKNDDYNMKLNSFTSNIILLNHHFYFYENDIYKVINNNNSNNNNSSSLQINKSELFSIINDNLDEFPEFVKYDGLNEELSTVIREEDFNDKVDTRINNFSPNITY